MNEKSLRTLEYNKIIDVLSQKATSSPGKKLCLRLMPSCDMEEINISQQQTNDALLRIYRNGSVSFSGATDITPSLMRLKVGATLGMGELLGIGKLLTTCQKVLSYSSKVDDDYTDSLVPVFEMLSPLNSLLSDINRCIIAEDTMSDDASPELKNIRRSIKVANQRIHEQLTSIINSQNNKDALQDSLITMRNNRYCVPVKAEYRNRIKGMIHDQSATGSTLFIEPENVVKLNNELSTLFAKEQTEIERILANLSNACALEQESLKDNQKTLAFLDFTFAKGEFAKEFNCTRPDFNNEHCINIKSARHPLIPKNKVVPIDIRLGEDFSMLVITGPNTGGKTVSLKTVGLLQLMGQAGLHIPANEHSRLGVFEEIYADIGDEQSIEQSLSTFSSHMVNTVSILEKADINSLVLFDELGAGTDPIEGAALATSILDFLHNTNVRVVATTHYSEIKIFALETPGIENACCEFDVASLAPTYRLLIGVPGKSNAFSISQKLGLASYIIDDAKKRIDQTDKKFEDVIADLEDSRHALEREREELSKTQEKVDRLEKELSQAKDKLSHSKEKILNEANEKARQILEEAKEYADSTIRNINKLKTTGDMKQMEQHRSGLNDKLKKTGNKKSAISKPAKVHKANELHLGDTVKVHSMNVTGTILSLPDNKGNMYVQMGILRSQVNISDIELVDEVVITGPGISKTGSGKIKMSKSMNISTEVKLIGMTVDEALSTLDKYLDDAYLAHLKEVTIIHGRGTGALKNAVSAHLKRTKYVDSFHIDEHNYGATIVTFK